jgi:hypothetical protein
VAPLEDKVSDRDHNEIRKKRDSELQVLRDWETANLVLHGVFIPFVRQLLHLPAVASATFVWSLIGEHDKEELEKYKIRGCTCDSLP